MYACIVHAKGYNKNEMKLPTLEEIKLTNLDITNVKAVFVRSKVGSTPCYLDLSNLTTQRVLEIIPILELVLRDMNLSPRFPYPFYLVTKSEKINSTFPIVESFENIPAYFKVDAKRITNKEIKMLEKIEIIRSQILNEEVQKRLEEYQTTIFPQKIIKSLAKEALFLEKIQKLLTKKENHG